eukprot:gene9340-biopygen13760
MGHGGIAGGTTEFREICCTPHASKNTRFPVFDVCTRMCPFTQTLGIVTVGTRRQLPSSILWCERIKERCPARSKSCAAAPPSKLLPAGMPSPPVTPPPLLSGGRTWDQDNAGVPPPPPRELLPGPPGIPVHKAHRVGTPDRPGRTGHPDRTTKTTLGRPGRIHTMDRVAPAEPPGEGGGGRGAHPAPAVWPGRAGRRHTQWDALHLVPHGPTCTLHRPDGPVGPAWTSRIGRPIQLAHLGRQTHPAGPVGPSGRSDPPSGRSSWMGGQTDRIGQQDRPDG